MHEGKSVILYDGECALCNRFLVFVLKHDYGYFDVIDQNSSDFSYMKQKYGINEVDTILLIQEDHVDSKSTAIAKILRRTSTCGKIVSFIMLFFPKKCETVFMLRLRREGSFFLKIIARFQTDYTRSSISSREEIMRKFVPSFL